ncbi:MAG: sigma-54-dependent Fis family transcriptional regulator [Bacteroidales bacterium]|nr:sigma-54-dependent Fis family transcriptional regulator [Bacteroidales bacterium]
MKKKVLIIDDDTYICGILENFLTQKGFLTDYTYLGAVAIKRIKETDYDLILCDFRLPDCDGFKILSVGKNKNLFTPVVIMTAYADIKQAVKLIKQGAFDYVTKPIYPEEILQLVKKAMEPEDNRFSMKSFGNYFIAGESREIKKIMEDIQAVAPTDITVLVEGETGSGKEYIARAIHIHSKRKEKPFVAVDCGALPRDLANSELFGHIKGSFTGAINDKRGYFEQANGGTLFLDEIGNLSLENQLKMLRAIQEKAITRLGDEKNISLNVRIIVATNEDLNESVKEKSFREDLYHRINVFKVKIPPLRERKGDIALFSTQFIERANAEFGKSVKGLSPEAEKIFLSYPWFGNIRELENVLRRSVLLTQGEWIDVDILPEELKTTGKEALITSPAHSINQSTIELKEATALAEKEVILNALIETNYNKTQAAKLLNIDRKTLYNKLKQLDIDGTNEA